MIAYLKGKLWKREADKIVVLNNGIGYEVLLPAIIQQSYGGSVQENEEVGLYIAYLQSVHQPKPLLVGFSCELEREFFEQFISVEDIGPTRAIKALTLPIGVIARAIEQRDLKTVMRLKGIGKRTAEKIIATLHGKVGKYALLKEASEFVEVEPDDLKRQVEEVLVKQLGHRRHEASQMVQAALQRNPDVLTAEELFEEVYRGQHQLGDI